MLREQAICARSTPSSRSLAYKLCSDANFRIANFQPHSSNCSHNSQNQIAEANEWKSIYYKKKEREFTHITEWFDSHICGCSDPNGKATHQIYNVWIEYNMYRLRWWWNCWLAWRTRTHTHTHSKRCYIMKWNEAGAIWICHSTRDNIYWLNCITIDGFRFGGKPNGKALGKKAFEPLNEIKVI